MVLDEILSFLCDNLAQRITPDKVDGNGVAEILPLVRVREDLREIGRIAPRSIHVVVFIPEQGLFLSMELYGDGCEYHQGQQPDQCTR